MRTATAALGLISILLAGCTTGSRVASTAPEAEKRLRKRQCDTLEASFRPSRDREGHIDLFGVSIGGRSATENRNSATDDYLFALNRMLLSCREWQRYQVSPQEFRAAQAELARAAQGPLKDAAAQQLLRDIANAFEEAKQGRDASQDEVTKRLTEIRSALDRPPVDPSNWTDTFQAFDARFDRVDERVANVEKLLAANAPGDRCRAHKRWTLLFDKGSPVANPDRLAAVTSEVRTALSLSPQARIAIVGFADGSGNEAANLILARNRAAQVGRGLLAAGIAVDIEAAEGVTRRLGANPASNRAVIVSLSC
ncbi:OmpA family protein [Sphingomonas sp. YR710]|jgi:outer membrane protein OmpA-like peptidoglycan-associated protein|uniref:OmpA family protein n=1 Tax=Sphingomonas sp. YR710 TaxID=1882773 RepID=UPI00087EECB3|nr:OmpA family protein [Sphingomonas sp. YR710]SDC26170.1 OmpA family protein [Sphingomonas sp. YR710]